jgi:hypothetical protein
MGIINYAISVTDDCQSTSSGSLSIFFSGQSPPFNVSETFPNTANTYSNVTSFSQSSLSAGTYIFTVSDSDTVSSSISLNITILSGITSEINSITHTTCGQQNGGVGFQTNVLYNYNSYILYKNGSLYLSGNTNSISDGVTGLDYGVYYFQLTSDGGCTSQTQNIIINSSTTVDYGFYTVPNSLCNGNINSGKIYITGLTGSAPFTYLWSGNFTGNTTSDSITGLTNGEYVVNVTDSKGCSVTKTIVLGNVPKLEFIYNDITQPTCNGSDGSVTLYFTGGTAPYYYYCDNGNSLISYASQVTFDNLNAGMYKVQATDASLCSVTATVNIPQLNSFTLISTNKTNSYCSYNDGTITAKVLGGAPPYTYSIDNGSGYSDTITTTLTSVTFKSLSSSTYTLTISDKNGVCGYSEDITISNVPLFEFSTNYSATTCGYQNGAIQVNVNSSTYTGTPLYQYSISSGGITPVTTATSYTFKSLPANSYTISVTDTTNLCTQSVNVDIPNSSQPLVTLFPTECLNGSGGTISVLIQEIDGPYDLTWSNNVNGQTGIYVTGLTAGTYSLIVSGSNGCSFISYTDITCNPLIESTIDYSLLPSISVQRTNPYFNFSDMYFSGYTSFVSDSQLCQLNNALFSLIIIIGNDTYTFPMYYSTSLTDYPSLEFYGPFLEESFLSIPYISNCVVDLTNNTIVVQSEIINGVEYYGDDIIQVAINISYNISCVSVSGIPC